MVSNKKKIGVLHISKPKKGKNLKVRAKLYFSISFTTPAKILGDMFKMGHAAPTYL